MPSRKTLVAAAAALAVAVPVLSAVALNAGSSDTADVRAATEPRTLNAPYECTNSFAGDVDDLQVNADVEATRTSTDRVTLAVSTGPLTLDLGQSPNVALASRMDLVVEGTSVQVSGRSTVTLDPADPPDFPVATGTATATGTTLTLIPGDLTIDVTVSGFSVSLNCRVKGTAPTLTIPVDDPVGKKARAPHVDRTTPGRTINV